MTATRRARPAESVVIRTSAGRRLTVGHLTLERAVSIGRVVLRVADRQSEGGHVWVSLTVTEAHGLADALLAQAAEVERRCGADGASGE